MCQRLTPRLPQNIPKIPSINILFNNSPFISIFPVLKKVIEAKKNEKIIETANPIKKPLFPLYLAANTLPAAKAKSEINEYKNL